VLRRFIGWCLDRFMSRGKRSGETCVCLDTGCWGFNGSFIWCMCVFWSFFAFCRGSILWGGCGVGWWDCVDLIGPLCLIFTRQGYCNCKSLHFIIAKFSISLAVSFGDLAGVNMLIRSRPEPHSVACQPRLPSTSLRSPWRLGLNQLHFWL
jgi:hypothetical protein